jgi:hypothetical protein
MTSKLQCYWSGHKWESRLVSHGMEYDRYDHWCTQCDVRVEYCTDYGPLNLEGRPGLFEALLSHWRAKREIKKY